MDEIRLAWVPGSYAVCRLESTPGLPVWCLHSEPLLMVTRTPDEYSIVCQDQLVPGDVRAERGFVAFRVAGAIDFAATGVLSALTAPLAAARISLFAISTYDTDYLLVRSVDADRAAQALTGAGFLFT